LYLSPFATTNAFSLCRVLHDVDAAIQKAAESQLPAFLREAFRIAERKADKSVKEFDDEDCVSFRTTIAIAGTSNGIAEDHGYLAKMSGCRRATQGRSSATLVECGMEQTLQRAPRQN
jgi:hypothetical protein